MTDTKSFLSKDNSNVYVLRLELPPLPPPHTQDPVCEPLTPVGWVAGAG